MIRRLYPIILSKSSQLKGMWPVSWIVSIIIKKHGWLRARDKVPIKGERTFYTNKMSPDSLRDGIFNPITFHQSTGSFLFRKYPYLLHIKRDSLESPQGMISLWSRSFFHLFSVRSLSIGGSMLVPPLAMDFSYTYSPWAPPLHWTWI